MRSLLARLNRHPLLSILIIWGMVYIPLALGVSVAFPEGSEEMLVDNEAVVNRTSNQTVYYRPSNNTTVWWICNASGQYLKVEGPADYIPERVILEGYGRLYTAAPHQQYRIWELPDDATAFIVDGGNAPIWQIKITEKRTDVLFYRERGAALLDGKLLYRDVPTLTPPLINLFWLLPVALGGSFLVFRLYFAVFALIVTTLILRMAPLKRSAAVVPALFMLCNPLTLHSTIFGIQDDIIITLWFGIAIWAFLRQRMDWGSVGVGLGMACKMWPVLLVPSLLTDSSAWVVKVRRTMGALAIIAASLLPFYLLAPDNVLRFLKLYTTGNSGGTLEGVSLWRYAGQFGLDPFVVLPLLGGGMVILFILVMRWHVPSLTTGALFVLLFLLLYPKLHSGYYLLLLLYIVVYWERRWIGWAGLGISVGVVGLDVSNWLGWEGGALALIPLLLAGGIWMLIAYMFIQTLKDCLTIHQDGTHRTLALTDTSLQTAQGPQQDRL